MSLVSLKFDELSKSGSRGKLAEDDPLPIGK